MRLFSHLSVLVCLAASLAFPVLAADPPAPPSPFNDAQKAGIESIVHDYLLKHPEIILQAVEAYQANLQADKDKAAKEELTKRQADLLHDPATQVLGNAASECAIVEFFDNQCPYCQANEPEIQKLLKDDNKVKLVLKEFPILGPISLVASKAALASVKQGKYPQFHEALLAHKGHYDKAALVDEIAKSVGLNLDQLHKDMGSPEIQAEIDKTLELGRALDINGTPGFVIGDQIISGASSVDELKKYVADACKG
ncbi:MAG TPA: DsbA family protein [Alphaproteobacteria bacterium]|jgi:protein-disulfide isomerase|nr:DsbA family protein [Alphaproteobacteria bacterium]